MYVRSTNGTCYIDVKFIFESEFHDWLIFLKQNGKLLEKYERLLGIYTGNVIEKSY